MITGISTAAMMRQGHLGLFFPGDFLGRLGEYQKIRLAAQQVQFVPRAIQQQGVTELQGHVAQIFPIGGSLAPDGQYGQAVFLPEIHPAQGHAGEHAVGGEHHLDQSHLIILQHGRVRLDARCLPQTCLRGPA
jgi:hypothetical protein